MHHLARLIPLTAVILLFASVPSVAQIPDSRAEDLVSCPVLLQPEPLAPYGFAKATLISLWYARNAAERSTELKRAANETDNAFSYLTATMRIIKTGTNDFVCAKRSVKSFAVEKSGENIKTAAYFLAMVYEAHIRINQRLIDLLKKLDSASQAELTDEFSTLQVERDQRWADLVKPTGIALMSLVDLNRTDENGKANRLLITKAQKQALLNWADDHFPEFKNGTPKDKWSDPAKTAQLYFSFFEGRKCSDE